MIERAGGSGHRRQQQRARILRAEPLCRLCMRRGFVTAAAEVDHIAPLAKGGDDSDDNLQPVCKPCHETKTLDDMGYAPKGCDASGLPTDSRHPWARG